MQKLNLIELTLHRLQGIRIGRRMRNFAGQAPRKATGRPVAGGGRSQPMLERDVSRQHAVGAVGTAESGAAAGEPESNMMMAQGIGTSRRAAPPAIAPFTVSPGAL